MINFIFAERVIIYGAQSRVLMTRLPSQVPMALILPLWWTHLLLLLLVFLRAILRRPLSLHSQMTCCSQWHLHLLPALRASALLVLNVCFILTTSAMSICSFLACFIMSSLALDWMWCPLLTECRALVLL